MTAPGAALIPVRVMASRGSLVTWILANAIFGAAEVLIEEMR